MLAARVRAPGVAAGEIDGGAAAAAATASGGVRGADTEGTVPVAVQQLGPVIVVHGPDASAAAPRAADRDSGDSGDSEREHANNNSPFIVQELHPITPTMRARQDQRMRRLLMQYRNDDAVSASHGARSGSSSSSPSLAAARARGQRRRARATTVDAHTAARAGGGAAVRSTSHAAGVDALPVSNKRSAAAANSDDDVIMPCGFCLGECVHPVTTPCGHNFCLDCLASWITSRVKDGQVPKCPFRCGKIQNSVSDLHPNKDLERAVAMRASVTAAAARVAAAATGAVPVAAVGADARGRAAPSPSASVPLPVVAADAASAAPSASTRNPVAPHTTPSSPFAADATYFMAPSPRFTPTPPPPRQSAAAAAAAASSETPPRQLQLDSEAHPLPPPPFYITPTPPAVVCELDRADVVLGDRIGSGALADVYRGTWKGRPVAVKIWARMSGESDASVTRESWMHRVSVMVSLRYPNIVRVHGICSALGSSDAAPQHAHDIAHGDDDDEHAGNAARQSLIVMQLGVCSLLESMELRQRLLREGEMGSSNNGGGTTVRRLPVSDVLRIGADVARALAFLHSRSPPLTHGRVKSSNVLMLDNGSAALSDFEGIEPLTPPSAWSAPENFKPGSRFFRLPPSDVYSLGVLLNEMLSSEAPFAGMDAATLRTVVVAEKQGPPLMDGPDIPCELLDVIRCACVRSPSARPTAVEVLQRLCAVTLE